MSADICTTGIFVLKRLIFGRTKRYEKQKSLKPTLGHVVSRYLPSHLRKFAIPERDLACQ